ncbi:MULTISPECIES: YecA family protein [Bradyrhizobium]|uniref:YecA family protein n=1 Tax=Bradyrhizobium TaxID=374 RepID=UPI000231CBE3|nr:SEC-C domain-containing protein [Bradyrhizobium japonicum]AJA61048.1 hypothetical protein RN69_12215 [Bradyrhizobium japonicum]KMJ99685.1 hypothetical protein CF64_10930 [Bradyrhizobium japonicum]MCS3533919.1 hypothetical protein [Bradyrhizobium japonicum]MCS3989987.1 hypothetical protein [Bradyrhizobium japonicum]MCS4015200.1 hypothetical protein [Bradyrhizobium japonicum]
MTAKFNRPCACGSGKKYKDCHYGKEDRAALSGWADVSILDRNRLLIRAAQSIFGFPHRRTWADFKRDIADEEIREFFNVHGSMWGPETNWVGILPKPGDGKLRGLYLGDVRPDLILRNLIRFSLYNDQILVIDPFPNARNIKPKYNPIENPGKYKAEMVKLIYFLFQIAPWVETGVVQLIPDPGDIERELRFKTADLARARLADIEPDPVDLAATYEVGRDTLKRFLFALDDKTILSQVERSGQILDEDQKKLLIEYARRELRQDPIAWERPVGDNAVSGQLSMMRSGVNLETALLICDITGAFPYTNMRSRWRELVAARDELSETARVWSPLANTFQSLEFKFLSNVDVGFATSIREDGRLESFRSLLRTIGKQASEISSLTALDSFVRDSKDALIGEHKKATAEWDKIQESFVKWAGTGLTAATTGLMTGHMAVDTAALSGAVLNTISQLGLRHMRKASFRKSNPMSVFIDLSEKELRGTTIY